MTESAEPERGASAIEGRDAMREALIQVIGQAQSDLLISSACLEAALYKSLDVVEALKQQALAQRRLQVRCIISDPKRAMEQAEPLIELARRLSSQFEFREPAGVVHQFEEECVIADRLAYLYRDRPDNLMAKFALRDGPGAHPLVQRFDERWLNSQPSMEFRRLG